MSLSTHHQSRAFSLVEITLALGLIAFAIVALLGLLSVGLNSSRESVWETTAAQIATDAISRYTHLEDQDDTDEHGNPITKTVRVYFPDRYYTYEGEEIDENSGYHYHVHIKDPNDSRKHDLLVTITSPQDTKFTKTIQASLFIP